MITSVILIMILAKLISINKKLGKDNSKSEKIN